MKLVIPQSLQVFMETIIEENKRGSFIHAIKNVLHWHIQSYQQSDQDQSFHRYYYHKFGPKHFMKLSTLEFLANYLQVTNLETFAILRPHQMQEMWEDQKTQCSLLNKVLQAPYTLLVGVMPLSHFKARVK